jgi:hypothetical protein
MKIADIIQESIAGDIAGDLNALLISVIGSNITEITTAKLVKTLRSQGYSVSERSILNLLDDHPMVKLATIDRVEFANNNPASATGDNNEVEKMKDQVTKQAQTAAKKAIGN